MQKNLIHRFFLFGFILGNRCQDVCNTIKVIRFQTSTALPAWCAPCPWPMIQSLWAPGSDSQCTTKSIATKLDRFENVCMM